MDYARLRQHNMHSDSMTSHGAKTTLSAGTTSLALYQIVQVALLARDVKKRTTL